MALTGHFYPAGTGTASIPLILFPTGGTDSLWGGGLFLAVVLAAQTWVWPASIREKIRPGTNRIPSRASRLTEECTAELLLTGEPREDTGKLKPPCGTAGSLPPVPALTRSSGSAFQQGERRLLVCPAPSRDGAAIYCWRTVAVRSLGPAGPAGRPTALRPAPEPGCGCSRLSTPNGICPSKLRNPRELDGKSCRPVPRCRDPSSIPCATMSAATTSARSTGVPPPGGRPSSYARGVRNATVEW